MQAETAPQRIVDVLTGMPLEISRRKQTSLVTLFNRKRFATFTAADDVVAVLGGIVAPVVYSTPDEHPCTSRYLQTCDSSDLICKHFQVNHFE